MPEPTDRTDSADAAAGQGGDLGLVPAAGKHAARPSQAERHQALHEVPPPGVPVEPESPTGPEMYRELEDDPRAPR